MMRFQTRRSFTTLAKMLFAYATCFTLSVTLAQTGDFNGDSLLDCGDVDLISLQIHSGANNPLFDLTADGAVDWQDLDHWLALAGAGPFGEGDVSLDGRVDHQDANILGLNWRRTDTYSYCHADFNFDGSANSADKAYIAINWQLTGEIGWSGGEFTGDGAVNSQDLGLLGLNWRFGVERPTAAVPEPATLHSLPSLVFLLWFRWCGLCRFCRLNLPTGTRSR